MTERTRWSLICPLLLALAAGCASKPKSPPLPLVPAIVALTSDQFAGSPLSGPRDIDLSQTTPEQALAIRVQVRALSSMPTTGDPLGAQARLVFASQGGVPVLPSTRLTTGARLLVDAALSQATTAPTTDGASAEFGDLRAALPAGATCVFQLEDSAPAGATSLEARRVILQVSRPAAGSSTQPRADRVQIAVVLDDEAPLPSDRQARDLPGVGEQSGESKPPPRPQPKRGFQREVAITDEFELSGAARFALFLPFRLTGGTAQAVMFTIDVQPGSSDGEHQRALAASLDRIAKSVEAVRAGSAMTSSEQSTLQGVRSALDAVSSRTGTRAALVFAAEQTAAALCADAALVADDDALEALAGAISSDSTIRAASNLQATGWLLDRATLALLTTLLNDGKLPVEMNAVLIRHTGEAARHAGSLEELLRTSGNRADFVNRVIAENYIYLEDNAPSARVRAFQWLTQVNRAPAGYDPLGPVRQRRAAIESALSSPAPATTQP